MGHKDKSTLYVLQCVGLVHTLVSRVNNREESIELPYRLLKMSAPIPLASVDLLYGFISMQPTF